MSSTSLENLRIIGPHSTVSLYPGLGLVEKVPTAFLEFGVLWREAFWLGRLGGDLCSPVLYSVRQGAITMSYEGEIASINSLPKDWDVQAKRLLFDLGSWGCRHNDIRPENILVKKGKLVLIDFAWATFNKDPIPEDWPKALGGKYKKGVHDFDDRYSLFKSLEAVERGEA